MKKNLKNQRGISVIEIIVCLAIIMITFWSFAGIAQYSLKIQEQSNAKIEAINLASEAIEAIRSVRNESWDNISSLSLETKYYPIISENKWILTLTDPGIIGGTYDRSIIIERVYRDINDNISETGTEDNQTKKITALVEWNDRGETKQIDLITYLTNWNN